MIHEKFSCELYFIRHGQSESNATPGFAAGVNFDAPLTSKGYEQARRLGQRLKSEGVKFDRVYSSTLCRAIQTTETMLEAMEETGRDFPKVEALIEQQVAGWRGVPVEQVYTHEMMAYIQSKGKDFVPPQGESYRMVQRRMTNWLEDELIYNAELAEKELSMRVAIVGHGTASRCLFQHIMGFDERFIGRMALENCSISRFIFNKDGWAVVSINDDWHVRESGQSANFEARP